MVQVAGEISSFRATYLTAYRWMLLARMLDDKFSSLYKAGKIHGGVFLGRGQEALSSSIGMQLRKGDIFAPLIRDAAGRLAFGETVLDAVRAYLGSPLGPMRARDGNVHRGTPRTGYLPMLSHLGAMVSVVNGSLMAHRFKGIKGTVGVSCLGEGATSTGAFHESLNQAAVEKLPMILVVTNNQYAYSTPNSRQFACEDLVDKALGYGIRGHNVDGNDFEACYSVVGGAIESARSGGGPQLVIARLLRLCGHGEHDDFAYLDAKLRNSPYARDCLKVSEEYILKNGIADQTQLDLVRREIVQEIEETVAVVQREPAPDPYKEIWSALSARHLCEGYHEA